MKVYIGGTFDCLHKGHIELFKRAKDYGEVIVSLNTDEFAERYKRKPIMNLDERIVLIEACKYVDKVIINYGCEDSKKAISRVKPDFIVHGDDWTGSALMKQMGLTQNWLDKNNIKMLYLPYTKGISTTDILKRYETSNSNSNS